MLQAVNRYIQLVIQKNHTVTFEDFKSYSFEAKQKLLSESIQKAKFYPQFSGFYCQIYNGSMIHCNIEKEELVVFLEGIEHNLLEYKARFDALKIEILKSHQSILATELIHFRGPKYILKISFTILPNSNVIEYLYTAMQLLR
jgi:hypothetical protein